MEKTDSVQHTNYSHKSLNVLFSIILLQYTSIIHNIIVSNAFPYLPEIIVLKSELSNYG